MKLIPLLFALLAVPLILIAAVLNELLPHNYELRRMPL